MTKGRDGARFRIPRSRRLTWDLLKFNHHIPLCGHDRRCNLSEVLNARHDCAVRISWPALVMKAVSIVAADIPELRQTWYRWPWNHLFQHSSSTAALTVQRKYRDDDWLFWGQVKDPANLSLVEIREQIDVFASGDVEQVFRRQLELAGLPTILRRVIWWWNLNVETKRRQKRLGTFFLSTLSGRGAEIQIPPSVHTACVTYGPIDDDGFCRMTIAYDHRVMDGVLVADALTMLEQTLNGQLARRTETIVSSQQTRCLMYVVRLGVKQRVSLG